MPETQEKQEKENLNVQMPIKTPNGSKEKNALRENFFNQQSGKNSRGPSPKSTSHSKKQSFSSSLKKSDPIVANLFQFSKVKSPTFSNNTKENNILMLASPKLLQTLRGLPPKLHENILLEKPKSKPSTTSTTAKSSSISKVSRPSTPMSVSTLHSPDQKSAASSKISSKRNSRVLSSVNPSINSTKVCTPCEEIDLWSICDKAPTKENSSPTPQKKVAMKKAHMRTKTATSQSDLDYALTQEKLEERKRKAVNQSVERLRSSRSNNRGHFKNQPSFSSSKLQQSSTTMMTTNVSKTKIEVPGQRSNSSNPSFADDYSNSVLRALLSPKLKGATPKKFSSPTTERDPAKMSRENSANKTTMKNATTANKQMKYSKAIFPQQTAKTVATSGTDKNNPIYKLLKQKLM